MKKIAIEEHFITSDFIKYLQPELKSWEKVEADRLIACLKDFQGQRIEEMDKSGIDLAILSLAMPCIHNEKDAKLAVQQAQQVNEFLAGEISKKPDRFKGLAHLPLQDPVAAAAELERCIRQYGFVGASISGQINGKYLDEEQFVPFWEKVQELDVPVYLPRGIPSKITQQAKDLPIIEGSSWEWPISTTKQLIHLIFGRTLDRFPSIKLILGRMGVMIPYLIWQLDSYWFVLHYAKIIRKHPINYLKENICLTTSGMHANRILFYDIDDLGEDNLMFSSNYPFESSNEAAQFLENFPLSETLKEKIRSRNAKNIFKL